MGTQMQTRQIDFGGVRYPFHHGIDCTDEIVDGIVGLEADRYVVIVDTNVEALHARPLLERLRRRATVIEVSMPATERTKSIELVSSALEIAFRQGMTRRSVVVAMGGGVVGNMAGLVAALAFRGVRLVHLPTTIIAAMDSVLSLKQAVNGRLGKNLIGTFHAPAAVFVDHTWLTTLAPREVRSGLAELAKNALAIVPESAELVAQAGRHGGALRAEDLARLVDPAIDAKARVMGSDSREKGRGLVLEYGHTLGHAIELASPGLLGHGEAVGVGMLAAAEIAARSYALSERDLESHRALLAAIGIGPHLARTVDPRRVLELLPYDNKRGYLTPREGEIPMILLDALGQVRSGGGVPLTLVPIAEIERAITSWARA